MFQLRRFLLLLSFTSIVFLFNDQNINILPDHIALKESPYLNKILLYKGNLPSGSFLKATEGNWQINQTERVDRDMANLLLSVLKKVRVKSVVEKPRSENVKNYLREKGIVVEYYYQDLLSKAIFVATAWDKPGYCYAMTENDQQPLLVYIPNSKYDLEKLLSLPSYSWKDRTLFDNKVEDIQALSVHYEGSPQDSFAIDKKGKDLFIDGSVTNFSPTLMKYLKAYKNIRAGAIVSNNSILVDSLKLSVPYCIISLDDRDINRSRELKIYNVEGNASFVYGQAGSENEVFIIPVENIQSLLVRKDELLKKAS